MRGMLVRLGLLALGMGAVEVGLGGALTGGSIGGWVLVLVGLPLLVAGSAWFMVPLLGGARQKGRTNDA